MIRLFRAAAVTAAFLAPLLPAPSAQASEPAEIELGYMPILPVSQLFVALGEGWFEDAGITPDPVQFQNGPAMVQALLAGQLDVAYLGIGPAMVARAKGADLKVVASAIKDQIALLALGELAPYFETDSATAFARFAADKGRKPVITTFPKGSVPETVLQYWLQEMLDIDPGQIEIVYQGAAQVQQALLTGAVDGAATLEPVVSVVTARRPDARVVASGSELFPDQPGAVLAVRESLISEHPEIVAALVEMQKRASEILTETPERAAPLVAQYVGGGRLDEAIVLRAIERSAAGFEPDPEAIRESTRVMRDFQQKAGTLSGELDLDALFDSSFYRALGEK